MRVALSHDWLNGMRGGEKCLEVFCELYPGSAIHTLFYERGKVSEKIAEHPIHTSQLQRFPKIFTHYRYYLPFFSSAIESFDLTGYDLVISSSHCVAKGIRKDKKAFHVCYCFTPVRYVWGFFEEYFGRRNFLVKGLIQFFLQKLKKWDIESSRRVDHFIAISEHVRDRIRRFYGRDADVIYPPVDTDFYTMNSEVPREDFYLVVSALVPYKKTELAIQAFNSLDRKLVIIGDGPEIKHLQQSAGKNIKFLGRQSDEVLKEHYQKARALIFPGEEDFGIVPVEAQACGCPVIALSRGGALETVIPGKTGIFFGEDTVSILRETILSFEAFKFLPEEARANALRFGKKRFVSEIQQKIDELTKGQK